MADTLVRDCAARRQPGGRAALLHLPWLWMLRAGWRKELMNLDAEQLRDCGLDPVAVRREAAKPFWRE